MNKKCIVILKTIAIIVFYVVLVIISKEHFDKLKQLDEINSIKNLNFKYLFIAIYLVIPNWLIESIKWRFAILPIQNISIKEAIKGVLKGIPPSTFTPNRIGETLGRPTILNPENRVAGGIATIYSGIGQMPIMAMGALFSAIWFNYIGVTTEITKSFSINWLIAIFIAIAIISTSIFYYPKIFVPIAKKNKNNWLKKLTFFGTYNRHTQNTILILSAIRYIIYCTQNLLLLKALSININIVDGMMAVFLTFGIISFIPRPALAELGVRCSVSAIVLNNFAVNPLLPAAASAILWIINILIPCIIGTILYFNKKNNKKKFAQ